MNRLFSALAAACRNRMGRATAVLLPVVLACPDATAWLTRIDDDGTLESLPAIVQTRCTTCHRPGGGAPFALVAPEDFRRRLRQIDEVLARDLMPPWPLDPGAVRMIGDAIALRPQERARLRRWLAEGAPDESFVRPSAPGSAAEAIADDVDREARPPDLLLRQEAPFTVPAEGVLVTRSFVLPVPASAMSLVQRIEVRPSHPEVARHALLSIDLTGSGRMLEKADPDPGYPAPGDMGLTPAGAFGGWSIGSGANRLPAPFVRAVPGASDLIVQFDFHPIGREVPFTFEVALWCALPCEWSDALVPVAAGSLVIDLAPGERGAVVEETFELPVAAALVEILPHAGAAAVGVEVLVEPPGDAARAVLAARRWHPDWHRPFTFRHPPELPARTRITARIHFDNSPDNPSNPFDPPRRVRLGHGPGFEQGLVLLQFAPADAAERPHLERLHRDLYLARIRARQGWQRSQGSDPPARSTEAPVRR